MTFWAWFANVRVMKVSAMLLKLYMEHSSKKGLQSLKTSVLSALKFMDARLKNNAIMNVGLSWRIKKIL